VLPETLLMLDLMVQDTCVDLRRMSQVVLADVGVRSLPADAFAP